MLSVFHRSVINTQPLAAEGHAESYLPLILTGLSVLVYLGVFQEFGTCAEIDLIFLDTEEISSVCFVNNHKLSNFRVVIPQK